MRKKSGEYYEKLQITNILSSKVLHAHYSKVSWTYNIKQKQREPDQTKKWEKKLGQIYEFNHPNPYDDAKKIMVFTMFQSKLPYNRFLKNKFSKYWPKVTMLLCPKTSAFGHKKLCDFDPQKIFTSNPRNWLPKHRRYRKNLTSKSGVN